VRVREFVQYLSFFPILDSDDFRERLSTMRIEPLGDKVVVKRLEPEQRTAGGIVLPDSAKERPRQGRVLSVGDGRRLSDGSRASLQVREGDRVLFSAYAGAEVVVEREELLIMGEDEILAILD
jgi:chaperonin GroES